MMGAWETEIIEEVNTRGITSLPNQEATESGLWASQTLRVQPFNEVQLPICHHLLYNIGVVLVLGPVCGLAGGTLDWKTHVGQPTPFPVLLCRFLVSSFHYCCFFYLDYMFFFFLNGVGYFRMYWNVSPLFPRWWLDGRMVKACFFFAAYLSIQFALRLSFRASTKPRLLLQKQVLLQIGLLFVCFPSMLYHFLLKTLLYLF